MKLAVTMEVNHLSIHIYVLTYHQNIHKHKHTYKHKMSDSTADDEPVISKDIDEEEGIYIHTRNSLCNCFNLASLGKKTQRLFGV